MDKNLKYYDDEFYQQHEQWRGDYAAVSKWIYENIPAKLFGDVGCGNGYMISNLHKYGRKVWGVDAAENFEQYVDKPVRKYVKKVDLTQDVGLDTADAALCFEVAEHIDKRYADVLIKNIVSTKAQTILFTAARPGQEGTHHINLQPKNYWLNKFGKYGYCLDAALTEKFKDDLSKTIETTTWYLDNIMVLQKCDDEKLRGSYSNSEQMIGNLKSRLEKAEARESELSRRLSEIANELHHMKNSKRWVLSSKLIRLIKK